MPEAENQITIRLATGDDVDHLTAFRAAFLAEVAGADAKAPVLLLALHRYFSVAVPAGEFIAYLAESGGKVVASSGLIVHVHAPSAKHLSGREGYIMNMYTLPEFRRRGIGTRLLKKLIEHARGCDCRYVGLHTQPLGRSVYSAAGFVGVDTEMRLNLL